MGPARDMRFSPARAGTDQQLGGAPIASVQPRACGTGVGGNPVRRLRRFSPRVRERDGGGDIAGSPAVRPRAAGNVPSRRRLAERAGSAPRVRGTGVSQGSVEHERRFSPARAGTARLHDDIIAISGSAARAERRNSRAVETRGSSAARAGNSQVVAGVDEIGPVQPARAGTGRALAVLPTMPVQPRACGRCSSREAAQKCGSAPRVRGTVLAARHTIELAVQPRACGNGGPPSHPKRWAGSAARAGTDRASPRATAVGSARACGNGSC